MIAVLSELFQSQYNLSKHITADEAMIPCKGRLGFKQYMKAKPHKWGINVSILAESATGYIYSFHIYTGRSAEADALTYGLCYQSVIDLVIGLEGKGQFLYTDNYYSTVVQSCFDTSMNGTSMALALAEPIARTFLRNCFTTTKKSGRGFQRHYSKAL